MIGRGSGFETPRRQGLNTERTTHFRWVTMPSGEEILMAMGVIRACGLSTAVSPRGGYTRYVRMFDDGYTVEGWAACSEDDNYVKAIGRNIARGRAYAWDRKDVTMDVVMQIVPLPLLMVANELERAIVIAAAGEPEDPFALSEEPRQRALEQQEADDGLSL